MGIKDLKPQLIWSYFDEITRVPRPSKKEEKIRAYLLDFAKKHNLTVRTDATGNVLICKSATPGCEDRPGVILQSHMDMVCEKNAGVEHDFDKDPIDVYIDGEWVKARGTTLGADNGIGMAAALAVLASDDLVHPSLEALFTVDEETGLTGAFGMEEGFISGKYLLNLDSEDEAEIFIGCAGGIDTTSTFTYTTYPFPAGYVALRISVSKLQGGHSGSDINEGRGNANKILARFLCQCIGKYDMQLCAIDGGNLRNAIPREAWAVVAVPADCKEAMRVDLNIYQSVIESELAAADPAVEITLASCDAPSECIDKATAVALLPVVICLSARSDRYEPGYSRAGRDIDQSGIGENERGEYDRRGYQPAQFGRVAQKRYCRTDRKPVCFGRGCPCSRRRLSGLEAQLEISFARCGSKGL